MRVCREASARLDLVEARASRLLLILDAVRPPEGSVECLSHTKTFPQSKFGELVDKKGNYVYLGCYNRLWLVVKLYIQRELRFKTTMAG